MWIAFSLGSCSTHLCMRGGGDKKNCRVLKLSYFYANNNMCFIKCLTKLIFGCSLYPELERKIFFLIICSLNFAGSEKIIPDPDPDSQQWNSVHVQYCNTFKNVRYSCSSDYL